jgi:ATPase subunit of ABC transporter with duplicated ATPase domains
VLQIQDLVYSHPNKEFLFEGINLNISSGAKVALIGNNGTGKSTLLQLTAGVLRPASGVIHAASPVWYVPQHFGQYNGLTVAIALGVADKLVALHAILGGDASERVFDMLADDWGIEERCTEALSPWGLQGIDLFAPLSQLSGGQKTRLFLAGIDIHQPELLLLDEPTNHMDAAGRARLYQYVQTATATVIVVSHDRSLLNLLPEVYELSRNGITAYGGNYDFYAAQKAVEAAALSQELSARETALRKAKETARETMERQQKLDARGRKKQDKAGVATIMLNTMRNNAEKSTARMKDVHAEKLGAIATEIASLRTELPDKDKMRLGFDHSTLHQGKVLIVAKKLNYAWSGRKLWPEPLSFELRSGERWAIKGGNGSGKTTLIRLILGSVQTDEGSIYRADQKAIYIDQDYSLVDNRLSIWEQAQHFNSAQLEEHEVKSRLTHFLFTKETWDKPTAVLSGGEKMRLVLACLSLGKSAPDMIVLDEPTNNLDIQNIEILRDAISDYRGTLLVVSHDLRFLEEIGIEKVIDLSQIHI